MTNRSRRSVVGCCVTGFVTAALFAVLAHGAGPDGAAAGSLGATFAGLGHRLSDNQFQKPLVLDSGETADRVAGDLYAVVDHPFDIVAGALSAPGDWCDVLILHLNTKYCRPVKGSGGSVLNVSIGGKDDQPLEEAHRVELAYRVAARTPGYLRIALSAELGPLGTRDYRIVFEAIPVEGGRTFLHLSYSYGFGAMGRLAMQVYLGTTGRGKVGFTNDGSQPDGRPAYVGGMRGLVERNTMRYYLAVEAYLGALTEPPAARLEKRLRAWFAAAERYPRQLHEIERDDYLQMKRKEYLRQNARLTAGVVIASYGGARPRP